VRRARRGMKKWTSVLKHLRRGSLPKTWRGDFFIGGAIAGTKEDSHSLSGQQTFAWPGRGERTLRTCLIAREDDVDDVDDDDDDGRAGPEKHV